MKSDVFLYNAKQTHEMIINKIGKNFILKFYNRMFLLRITVNCNKSKVRSAVIQDFYGMNKSHHVLIYKTTFNLLTYVIFVSVNRKSNTEFWAISTNSEPIHAKPPKNTVQ